MPTVTAAVMPAPHAPIELREFPVPELEPGAALLRTTYSEVCGTDVHLWHGRLSGVPYPIIPGHVSTGVLDRLRGPLTGLDGTRLREGDPVVFFDVHRTCGRCYACTVARTPTKCPSRRVYGITDSADEGLFGGWAEAIYLEPGVGLARLPDERLPRGLHRRRLWPADRRARHRARRRPSRGCGARAGRRRRRAEHHRPRARGGRRTGSARSAIPPTGGRWPATWAPTPCSRSTARTAETRRAAILAATGARGPDVVIEAAGSARAVEEGLDLVRDGGVYVIAGHYTNVGDSTINAHTHINRKHLDVRGCWGSEARHFLLALQLLARHGATIPWSRIGGATFGLAELNDALAQAAALRFTKALVDPPAAERLSG